MLDQFTRRLRRLPMDWGVRLNQQSTEWEVVGGMAA